jgi:hypothetical protein
MRESADGDPNDHYRHGLPDGYRSQVLSRPCL